jgi:sterol desaturase/sphingolipid hydroxylase (fatty acid hydroxylase superfamily)
MLAVLLVFFIIWFVCNGTGLIATWAMTRLEQAASLRARPDALAPTWEEWRTRLPLIGFNLLSVLVFTETAVLAFPEVLVWHGHSVVAQASVFVLILFCDDAWFYAYHRFLHESDSAFLHVHHIHHRATAPVPMDYIYVHPLEWMLGTVGIAAGVVATFLVFGDVPAAPVVAYAAFRNVRELLIHSGLPSVGSMLPWKAILLAPPEHHDLHHLRLRGNYAAMLAVWDRALKTEIAPDAEPAASNTLERLGCR